MFKERAETTPRPSSRIRGLGLVALGLVVGIGGTLLIRPARGPAEHAHEGASVTTATKPMFQCPMHPQIMMDHEADCPICGMKLVPMEGDAPPSANPEDSGDGTDAHAVVTIDLERQQLIGLKTETVAEGTVSGEIRAVGRVAVDETRVRKVNVKVEGFVEKLFVDFTGSPVAKGAPLFSLYSPEFVSAQREYLLALELQKRLSQGALQGDGSDLAMAARRRLERWDVPPDALDRLDRTGEVQRTLVLRSPIAGVVTVKNVVEGARITPSDIPFEITDLSRVWVQADLFETEVPRVRVGQSAVFTLAAFPGEVFQGRVAFVDPILDPTTRTAKVRLEFPNPKGDLRPEMFGEVVLRGPSHTGLLIPLDAVLDAGTSKVVFVALGQGRFEPREVTTGITVGEKVEILRGLEAGEKVIVRANFLVDSESRLKAALAHLSGKGAPSTAAPAGGHQH